VETNDADSVMNSTRSSICCITVISWCADKHLSVNIEGDVDVARAMEQTSTVTGLLSLSSITNTFC